MKASGEALILAFFFTSCIFSQLNPGARQVSLSHSDAASGSDVFSLYNNPAGLGMVRLRELGIYYSPAPFGLKELSNGSIAYAEPFSFGSAALGSFHYGYALYREFRFAAGIAYNVSRNVTAGLTLFYHTVKIKNYGEDQAVYFDAGTIITISDYLKWGAALHNFNKASFGREEGQIPVVINSGITVSPFSSLLLNIGFEKDLIYKPSLQCGIDFRIIEFLSLRTGFATEPDKFSAGIGIFYSMFNLDYAVFTHQALGLTHQIALILRSDKFIPD